MKVPVTELRPGMILKGGRMVTQALPQATDDRMWGVITEPGGYVAHSRHTIFDVLGPIP